MPAGPKKLYGQPCYFQILNTFLYDFCVGNWLANLTQCTVIFCIVWIIVNLYSILSLVIYISLRLSKIIFNVFHYYINRKERLVR